MTFSILYTLTTPTPAESALAGVSASQFALSGAQIACDATALTQADFLALFERILPYEYIQPLKSNPNSGYELFEAMAAIGERLSLAMKRAECGLVISYSGTGSYATGEIVLYRDNADAGAVTVLAGSLVETSDIPSRRFVTTEDAVFGALDTEVTVAIQAVAKGYEYNVNGQITTAALEVIPGDIDTAVTLLQSPAYGDPTIKVRQLADTSGGAPDDLYHHGDDRGLYQDESETEDSFRERIKALPEVVTPAAIRSIIARILDPIGVTWELIETWRIDYVNCFDAPSPNVGTPTYTPTLPPAPYDSDTWYYDDTRDPWPFRGRMLSDDSYRGAFFVIVDLDSGDTYDYGFAYDDPETVIAGLTTHGTPAYDTPALGFPIGAYDGYDFQRASAIVTLNTALDNAKAAGIAFAIDYPHSW